MGFSLKKGYGKVLSLFFIFIVLLVLFFTFVSSTHTSPNNPPVLEAIPNVTVNESDTVIIILNYSSL